MSFRASARNLWTIISATMSLFNCHVASRLFHRCFTSFSMTMRIFSPVFQYVARLYRILESNTKKIWRLEKVAISSELLMRLELTTSSLPRKCSTTELQQHSHALFRKRVCKSNQQFSIRQIFGGHIIDFPAASILKSAKTAIFPPKWLPIQVLLRPRSCVAFQSGRTRSVRRALQPYMSHQVWQSPPSRDCR